MRLTLRTLLAYLDDILEPSQTKEIGAKISESSFASSLVNRIRDVMRRRRLTAPELQGPGSGLDPNVVAEYLDNVLPPDKVADVERVCLESDVHLAEVAACHQVLTLALGEPVQVNRESRETVYALGPISSARQAGRAPAGDAKSPSRERSATGPKARFKHAPSDRNAPPEGSTPAGAPQQREAGRTGTFEDSIPDYLKPRPLWRRALPYAVVGLIAAAWIGLLVYGPPIKPTGPGEQQPAADQSQDDDTGVQVAANGMAAAEPQQRESADERAAEPTPGSPSVPEPVDRRTIDPPPPPDEPERGASVVDETPPAELPLPEAPKNLQDEEPTLPPRQVAAANPPDEPPGLADVGKQPDVEPVPRPPADVPTLQYNSPDGILMRYDANQQDWVIMPHRAIIHPGERLISPEPFDAIIEIGEDALRATALGGTALSILRPSQAAAVGFEVEQGRMILRRPEEKNPKAENDGLTVPRLGLRVRDKLWRVELLTPGTVCGIEITPVQPDEPEQVLGPDNYTGALYVRSGSVRLADAGGDVNVINGEDWFSLTPQVGDDASTKPPLLAIPEWLVPGSTSTLTWRRFADLFEKEFYVGDPPKTLPLTENVPPMIKHNRAYISALAVKCLKLVGDYESLASALNAEHEESRMAAIEGLRNWLPSAEGNGELLKDALARQFPDEEAQAIYRLLWGYDKQDARDSQTSRQLVDWLTHNNIVIRELAFYHIYRLTGRKYSYHPMRTTAQRDSAVRRWYDHIQKEGALIGQ